MIYNFRYDRQQRSTVLQRARAESVICQGWGGGQHNLDLTRDAFIQECFECYKPDGMKSTRVPTNLWRIRQFKDGDLLAVPHLPEDGKVSILVIDGDFPRCYEWKLDPDHLNHRIRIKKSYGLESDISIYYVALASWYAKLQWLRLPVLPIPEHQIAFEGLISEIEKSPNVVFAESGLDDYLAQMLKETVDELLKKLRKISPSIGPISFETVCERLVRLAGYEVVEKNRYDKLGGDFDLRCVRSRTSASPFESGDVNLYVQAKKYEGTTDEQAVQQLLKMMEKDATADGCVMSLGDDYSAKAVELAAQNDITLMNGRAICQLLLKTMFAE
jgi:hypothetical protein